MFKVLGRLEIIAFFKSMQASVGNGECCEGLAHNKTNQPDTFFIRSRLLQMCRLFVTLDFEKWKWCP
jgi:hypothetical protein